MAGMLLACLRARRYGLQTFDVFAAMAFGTVGGLAGAVLLDLVVQWRQLVAGDYPWDQPGMVFFGGLLGGLGATAVYARMYGVPLLSLADAAVPGVALGHAFGRVGCLFGACCYGRPVDASSSFGVEVAGALRHPVQLYEAAALGVLTAGLLLATPRFRRSGALFATYLMAYGVVRLVMEQFRGDDDARGFLLPGLSTSTAISLGLLLAGWALWRSANARAA
jgi:phosphatidylglycerol:prolipoprotein diacylglycerol transferase